MRLKIIDHAARYPPTPFGNVYDTSTQTRAARILRKSCQQREASDA